MPLETMNVTSVAMNSSLTTMTNPVGLAGGVLILFVAITVGIYLAHLANDKKSWVGRLLSWLIEIGLYKFFVGAWTILFVGGFYYAATWLSSSDGQSGIAILLQIAVALIAIVGGVILLGHFTEPVWMWIWEYMFGKARKKTEAV